MLRFHHVDLAFCESELGSLGSIGALVAAILEKVSFVSMDSAVI